MIEDDEDPSDEYIKAYNEGYQMARHEPELLDEVLKSQDSQYIRTMSLGKEQFEHEKLMTEMKSIRDKQKMNIKRKPKF